MMEIEHVRPADIEQTSLRIIEKEIRDNPAKYPLLTKYYLNAE